MRWEIVYKATEYAAEEVGIALRNSAFSPNIRERMDHSVAVVDAEGRIVAQAEHIPVHLGSMHVGVANLLAYLAREGVELEEGDAVLTNDPYISGTHLNDVMVLYPVFWRGRLAAYVASKAHYVDVGGPLPASLNPNAKTIYEEGVVVPPVKILVRGRLNREALAFITANFKVPEAARGDLEAQLAASRIGAARVRGIFEKYGDVSQEWREAVEYGRRLALGELAKWPRGVFEAVDYLDWRGSLLPIRVALRIGDGVSADFAGTAPQQESPINAVFGVTFAAVSFAVRAALGVDVPTNHGFYSVVEVKAPEGSLVNPVKPAAVGAGNLETSQRIADVVFLALSKALPGRIPAAGSGTMMNVMMGGVWRGRRWSYYETVGGGSGGRPNGPGVSGVHVNMTNTLNTPIEVAEREYPLLFTAYRIREGSGGRGRHRGGDGIVRAFKVLAPTTLSIIASRFRLGPWGLDGGEPGKPARVVVRRRSGEVEIGSESVELEPGDEVIIETPGGGGYGPPSG